MTNDVVLNYVSAIQKQLATGHAQEHSYRPALEALFKTITELNIVNEPKGSAHGRPDFIFLRGELPLAYAEAKDLHVSLDKIEKSEQMTRYFGYANLILTNGLEFRFYKNGVRYGDPIVIAIKHDLSLEPQESQYSQLCDALKDFIAEPIDSIRSAKHLAQIMGGKARRLRDNITAMIDPEFTGNIKGDEIKKIMNVLKEKLIHDLTIDQFADLYAQTLVYGLFVARYHDDTPDDFSRTEARERIPSSNHLLHQFFDHIAGANFEVKLKHIVDELCDVFVHSDVHALIHGLYQRKDDAHDPVIHFYEDFLKEYDPKQRVERGVFYTPLPVVRYIVRSVDELLKEHFGLAQGLADRATIDWKYTDGGKTSIRKIDRVQVLDPAVGTGTFLNEVILHINKSFKGQEGMWKQYVDEHLIPRLHGFELMMASYTIAHLKLSMTLAETGITDLQKRLRVFLTNSLEEAPEKDDTLFREIGLQGALTEEALAAEEIKRDLPIMAVMGNPPYSVTSSNKGDWIIKLIKTYKDGLKEKSYNALSDDYVKFIRFAHHLIEKNGQGIVAMITNNSFLDGITHRKMRESLLKTFNHLYILNLHGSSKKKEVSPDGSKDENVFDIMQGVCIFLFVKNGENKKMLGQVHHTDLYGRRETKYEWLENHNAQNTTWKTLEIASPNFYFVPKDFQKEIEYTKFISLKSLFINMGPGIETGRDALFIDFSSNDLSKKIEESILKNPKFIEKYNIKDSTSFKLLEKLSNTKYNQKNLKPIQYSCLDFRYIYYDPFLLRRGNVSIMNNMDKNNVSLCLMRSTVDSKEFNIIWSSSTMIDKNFYGFQTYQIPLYIYTESDIKQGVQRFANFNSNLLLSIINNLKLRWIEDGEGDFKASCGPQNIFDYIYALLHSPTYREQYKEFLKIDFPRIPFTSKKDLFWKLVALGKELRLLHLMESPKLESLITTYPIEGSNEVEKVSYEDSTVHINPTQYFDGVPKEAWEFYIGGYQPAQKWLKDRKGRTLTSDDLWHYQKVIIALTEAPKIMAQIDEEIMKNGGFPVK